MINVLELIDGGFLGGGQTHILSLVKCLDKKKFKATISASSIGEFKNVVRNEGFDFKDIELSKFYKSKHLKALDKIVKENEIDIIHSHGGVAGMYARFYKKKFNNINVIHTIHGIHYIHSTNFLRRFISLSIEQYLVPCTDKFICVSDTDYEVAKKIKIINPKKTSIIKNGIDLNKFSKKLKDNKLLEKLRINEDAFIIGNISRFDLQKNQGYIISKAKYILSKYPKIKILFAGDGKFLDECMLMAQRSDYADKIIFAGGISNTEDYYSLFDVFVFPSLWEGLSISLIEAMASSNCIIASDIAANKELIKDKFNGLTFNLDDGNEFLMKLEELSENRNLRDSLSEQACKDSMGYSEKVMIEKIEKEYLKLQN